MIKKNNRRGLRQGFRSIAGLLEGLESRLLYSMSPMMPANPTVTIGDTTAFAGKYGQMIKVPVTLSYAVTNKVMVKFTTVGDTAVKGADFFQKSGTVTFKKGQTTAYIKVWVRRDLSGAVDNAFNIELSNPKNARLDTSTDGGALGRIAILNVRDADVVRPTMTVSDAAATVGDADVFTVTLSQASTQDVSVRYQTAAGSDVNGEFTAVNGILTIPAGQTTGTISVATDENGLTSGTFSLKLTAPTNAVLVTTTATGTINATVPVDPIIPTMSVSNASTLEGATGTSTLTFTVTLSQASDQDVTVDYTTADGTAIAGTDYTAASGTLTIAAGDTTGTVTVTVLGLTVSPTETLSLNLSNATNATMTDGTAVGTIQYGEANAIASNLGVAVDGAWSGSDQVVLLSSFLTGNSTTTLSSVEIAGTGAIEAGIFSDNGGMPGMPIAFLTYSGSGDVYTAPTGVTLDANTTYWVAAAATDGGSLSYTNDATGTGSGFTGLNGGLLQGNTLSTIDPTLGRLIFQVNTLTASDGPAVSVSAPTVLEVAGNVTSQTMAYTVTLSSAAPFPVTVHYGTSDGNAVAGTDYITTSGTLTFAPGQTSATVDVTVDGLSVAPTETLNLNLTNVTNGSIATATGIGTIQYAVDTVVADRTGMNVDGSDSDPDNLYAQSFVTGSSAPTIKNVIVSGSGENSVSIYTSNIDGEPGEIVGTLTYTGGESYTSSGLTLDANTKYWVIINAGNGGTVDLNGTEYGNGETGMWYGPGTFIDDFSGLPLVKVTTEAVSQGPTVSVSGTTLMEPSGTTTNQALAYTVTLSSAASFPVTVHYSTADGTAVAGTDYTATSGTLTFAPGETSKTVNVSVLAGTTVDAGTILLNLSNATNTAIATSAATGTVYYGGVISDNLANAPQYYSYVMGQASSFTTGSSSSELTSVTINAEEINGGGTLTMSIYSNNNGQLGTLLGTLTPPGSYSSEYADTVFTGNGIVLSPNETYWVVLTTNNSSGFGVTGTTIAGTGAGYTGQSLNMGAYSLNMRVMTAALNTLSVGSASVAEPAGSIGTKTMTFTVSLAAASTTPVTVNYATADGNAVAGTDYVATSGTLTFAPGETSKTVDVTVNGLTVASTETLNLTLSDVTNGVLASAVGVGTIQYTTDVVLADNTFAMQDNTSYSSSTFYAASFITDSGATTLGNVTVSGSGENVVSIYTDSGDSPGTLLKTLTYAGGDVYTAVGMTLDPGTKYWLVANQGASGYLDISSSMGGFGTGSGFTGESGQWSNGVVYEGFNSLIFQVSVAEASAGPAVSVSSSTLFEPSGTTGTQTMGFNVTLSSAVTFPVTVAYSTTDGSAVAGTDYTATSGTLTFAAGETSKTVDVSVAGGTITTAGTLSMNLSTPGNGTIGAGSATGTIFYGDDISDNLSNSGGASINISYQPAESFTTGSSYVELTNIAVDLFQEASGTATMSIYTNNNGALGTLVGTLTPPTTFGEAAVFTGNGIVLSPNTTYWVQLTGTGFDSFFVPMAGNNSGTGSGFTGQGLNFYGELMRMRIMTAPVNPISIGSASVNEDPSNPSAQTMTFTVTLGSASNSAVTVDYATADGTATSASGDYMATSGTLTFAPGETSKTITVTVNANSASADETFNLNLTSPTGAVIGAGTGVGTIAVPVVQSDNLNTSLAGYYGSSLAEGFTTTSTPFTLTQVTLMIRNDFDPDFDSGTPTATVSVYTDNGGQPGIQVGTLQSPSTYSSSGALASFTTSGIALSANTVYWVVATISSGPTLGVTYSASGSGAGFMANNTKEFGGSNWTPTGFNMQMQIE